MKDYYAELDVPPTATYAEIKSQYRFLLQAWHPDKFRDLDQKALAEEKTKRINEAYSVLSDPTRRARYDGDQRQPQRETVPPSSSEPTPPPPVEPDNKREHLRHFVMAGGLVALFAIATLYPHDITIERNPPPVTNHPTRTPLPVRVQFWADENRIEAGELTFVRWRISGANIDRVTLDGLELASEKWRDGFQGISLEQDTTLVLKVFADDRMTVNELPIRVVEAQANDLGTEECRFVRARIWADYNEIERGESAVIRWNVTGINIERVTFDGEEIGEEDWEEGFHSVSPRQDTTYVLRVTANACETVRRRPIDVTNGGGGGG